MQASHGVPKIKGRLRVLLPAILKYFRDTRPGWPMQHLAGRQLRREQDFNFLGEMGALVCCPSSSTESRAETTLAHGYQHCIA